MRSTVRKTKLAGALAAAVVAATIAVPAAYAMPTEPTGAHDSSAVEVAPPPSSIAASAGEKYEELRASGTQDDSTAVAPQAVEPSAPGGFDLVSAAIGAVAAAGLSLVAMAALGMRRPTGRAASA